jgi:hypothetical protein
VYAHTNLSRQTLKDFRKRNKLDQSKNLQQEIEAILIPSQELVSIGKEIKKDIRKMNTIDLTSYQQKTIQAIAHNQENRISEVVSVEELVKEILETTIIQEVENFVRSVFLIYKECQ